MSGEILHRSLHAEVEVFEVNSNLEQLLAVFCERGLGLLEDPLDPDVIC